MTWVDQARAAVAELGDAALCGVSALRAVDGPGRCGHDDTGPMHVAVEPRTTLTAPPGVILHRRAHLARRADWLADPPRMYVEEALLDLVAAGPEPIEAVSRLTDAVRSRVTTPDALQDTLRRRPRLPRRDLIAKVLTRLEGSAALPGGRTGTGA